MSPTPSSKNPQFNDLINDVESSFREGVQKLTHWSDQARSVIDERPGSLGSSLGIIGFMAGTLLRRGSFSFKHVRSGSHFASDPFLIFIAGAAIGAIFGPQLLDRSDGSDESRH